MRLSARRLCARSCTLRTCECAAPELVLRRFRLLLPDHCPLQTRMPCSCVRVVCGRTRVANHGQRVMQALETLESIRGSVRVNL